MDFVLLSIGNLSVIGLLVYLLHNFEGESKHLISGHWGFISFIAYSTYGLYVYNMQIGSKKFNFLRYFFTLIGIRGKINQVFTVLICITPSIVFYSLKVEIPRLFIDLYASICIISMNHFVGNYHRNFGFRKANHLLVSISVARMIMAFMAAQLSENIVFILFCSHSAMVIGAFFAKVKIGRDPELDPENRDSLLRANFLMVFFWVIFFSDILFKNWTLFVSDAILLSLFFKSLFTFLLFPLVSSADRNNAAAGPPSSSRRILWSYVSILIFASIVSVLCNKLIVLWLFDSNYKAGLLHLFLLASGNFVYAYLLYFFLLNLRTFKSVNLILAVVCFSIIQLIVRNFEVEFVSVAFYSIILPLITRLILALNLTKIAAKLIRG
jgi:hypothetical protein